MHKLLDLVLNMVVRRFTTLFFSLLKLEIHSPKFTDVCKSVNPLRIGIHSLGDSGLPWHVLLLLLVRHYVSRRYRVVDDIVLSNVNGRLRHLDGSFSDQVFCVGSRRLL